ncbi:MAG: DUF6273 domain-containing protein [Lachnospiraceae bacterium]|nr:DUF6273 domain-containing protein [Lachnospiraceae bacterium]
MGKQMKRYAKTLLCVILSMLMVISVFQFGTIKTNAEGNETDIPAETNEEVFDLLNIYEGEIIKLGKYEQDGNLENGKEDIEWIVVELDFEEDRALLLSRYALDVVQYQNPYIGAVTWETCSLRGWMNNNFYNTAFNDLEKNIILTTSVKNDDNRKYDTDGGSRTNDKIFCLSVNELEKYIGYDYRDNETWYGQEFICTPTQYAKNNGAFVYTITENDYNNILANKGYTPDVIGLKTCRWWLRTPGCQTDYACRVGEWGNMFLSGVNVNENGTAVRPALNMDLSIIYPTSISLDKTDETIKIGDELTLNATLKPDDVTEKTIKWSVSDPSIASVNNGKVTTKNKTGKVTVTAETVNGLKASCNITVVGIYPKSISLDKKEATMYYGGELTLKATLKPDNATEKEIKWSSSDPSIASVNNGKVKAKSKAGTVKVTAETVNGLKATCDITVLCENNPNNPFADVKSGDWKYNAAIYVYEKGYMTGKGTLAGKVLFGPDANITRAEFVQILYSAEGKPAVEYTNRFKDVPKGQWFTNAVLWAESEGIVAGNPDGIFDVYGNATREQMAAMFYKYAVYKGYDTSVKEGGKTLKDFTDSGKVSNWAKPAVEWAVSRGIISGKGKPETGYQIDPQGNATRVETAAILRTFINSYAELESDLITEEYIYIDDVDNDIEENDDFSEESKIDVLN